MLKNKLILIGGGGHCKACIDIIAQDDRFDIAGVLDLPEKLGSTVSGSYQVIGSDADIPRYHDEGCSFFVTLGQIISARARRRIFEQLKFLNAHIPTIIAKTAYVSASASIGTGTIIMHRAFVNAEASVAENCILNTAAIVEHETHIGSHTHISTNAVLNGNCSVGSEVFIGSQATLVQGISVCDHTIVGAAAVITRNIMQPGTYVGNPARNIKK